LSSHSVLEFPPHHLLLWGEVVQVSPLSDRLVILIIGGGRPLDSGWHNNAGRLDGGAADLERCRVWGIADLLDEVAGQDNDLLSCLDLSL